MIESAQSAPERALVRSQDRLTLPVAVLLGLAVQVQVTLPLGASGLRANAADIPVAAIAVIFAAAYLLRPGHRPGWLVPGVPVWLAGLTAIMTAALGIAWVNLGHVGTWALVNKYAGWFALMAYFCAGAWIVTAGGEAGRRSFALALGAGVAVTACAQTAVLILDRNSEIVEASLLAHFLPPYDQITGLAGNPNRFAFLVLVAFAAAIAYRDELAARLGRTAPLLMQTALIVGLWFTASRAAWLALAVMLAVAAWRRCPMRTTVGAVGLATAILAGLPLANVAAPTKPIVKGVDLLQIIDGASREASAPQDAPNADGGQDGAQETDRADSGKSAPSRERPMRSGDLERLATYLAAFALWRDHPVAGAGLGAHLARQRATTERDRKSEIPVIHSTPLWLLAETGLVGFGAFAAAFVVAAGALWRAANGNAANSGRVDGARTAALLLLAGFAVMSLAHELLYQRTLWLLLGAALAVPLVREPRWGRERAATTAD